MLQRRRAGRLTHAIGVLLGALTPVIADAEDATLETIVVTGSRIARTGLESPSPIVTVPATAFEQTGTVSVERVLERYPQFVPTSGATSNEPSNDGQANVSLRGLGSNRTLVLLDGRRLMPADGNGSVDLNILPPSLIRSVEVLTGGASATYGSDAMAGVVNFELVDKFEGVAVDTSVAQTDQGDGEEYSFGLTGGLQFGAGRGSVTAYVGYSERAAIQQSVRAFSKYPLEYYPDETAGLGPGGAFLGTGDVNDDGLNIVLFSDPDTFNDVFAGYGYPPGSVLYQFGIGVNADGTLFTSGNGDPGTVVNYRGYRDPVMYSDRLYAVFNSAPTVALQMPLDRISGMVRSTYTMSDSIDLYGQALYAGYTVERQLAPVVAGIVLIPPTNPSIPADLATLLASRPNPAAPQRYFRRASEVGPQTASNDRNILQITGGVRGRLAKDWSFDAYVQVGENDRTERQTNNVSLSRLQDLTFAPDGGLSICEGGFNPYRAGSLSSDCAKYIRVNAANEITVQQAVAEASVNGPLASLPAGPLSVAFGLFSKRDDFEYDADAALSKRLPGVPGIFGPRSDIVGFSAAPDRSGDESNVDAYAEFRVPLLEGRPWVQSLELDLGYRYSDYTQAGGFDSYKAELMWVPLAMVRLRSSYQHAVRAPSIEELYYPQLAGQFGLPVPDPCDTRSAPRTENPAQVEALCLAQGLPPEFIANYQYELRFVDGVAGGNPDLDPEMGDTYTVGFVLTPHFADSRLHALELSVDWYSIAIKDGIGRLDSYTAIERCFDGTYNPTYSISSIYCSFFTRDAESGNIFVSIIDRNLGRLDTAGVDVELDAGIEIGRGMLSLGTLVSYIDNWTYQDPSGGEIEYSGTLGGSGLGRSLPRWKSLTTLTYAFADATVMFRWQHLDRMSDVHVAAFSVPAFDYFDLGMSYDFKAGALRGLSLQAGADNVTDQEPPIFPSSQQANTDPSQYDVLGRRYYVRFSYAIK